jgi:hypothetical protein
MILEMSSLEGNSIEKKIKVHILSKILIQCFCVSIPGTKPLARMSNYPPVDEAEHAGSKLVRKSQEAPFMAAGLYTNIKIIYRF